MPCGMESSKARVRATYERIAESYATARTRPWPEVLDFISTLSADSFVLDLGSGHGRHARPLASAGHRVVGLDLSRRLLSIGRRDSRSIPRLGRIEWIEGEATALPFRDSTFDAGVCIAVLHHLRGADRIKALDELRRVLRRGGRVFVSVWSRDDPDLQRRLASGPAGPDVEIPWTLPDGSLVPRFYHLFEEGELERLIIESGLHVERFFPGSGNYFALAKNDG